MAFAITDRIGDIVAALPKAGDVFKQHKIDFCCGGNRSLSEVAHESGIEAAGLVAELNNMLQRVKEGSNSATDWTKAPLSQLVGHILSEHHGYLHTTLPVLSELVTTILRVHGPNHAELAMVHRLYNQLKLEFEQHLIKEETLVFPKIVDFAENGSRQSLTEAVTAVAELEHEHEATGDILKQLRQVTHDYQVPEDGCGTYHYTFQKLVEVEDNTFTHIHLENNILFPRLEDC